MRALLLFCLGFCLLVAARPAWADIDQIQAREVARNNNCAPSKIDIFQQSLGSQGATVYRITCTMPKTTDDTSKGANELLVSCEENLCRLLRPLTADAK